MRVGTSIEVSAANRVRLEAVVVDRNNPQKWVWRAEIILATAEGLGTNAIMRRDGASKPFVWTADPDHIIEKVRRGHQAFNVIH